MSGKNKFYPVEKRNGEGGWERVNYIVAKTYRNAIHIGHHYSIPNDEMRILRAKTDATGNENWHPDYK